MGTPTDYSEVARYGVVMMNEVFIDATSAQSTTTTESLLSLLMVEEMDGWKNG